MAESPVSEPLDTRADAAPVEVELENAASAGRVALVTGAARRLGREIALDLARHGFDIAVHYRGDPTEAQGTVCDLLALGVQAQAFHAELSDETACRGLLPAVVERFGRVDAVVNNAAAFEYDTPATFSHADMELHWRANTAPAVLLATALHAHRRQYPFDEHAPPGVTACVVNLIDQKLWNPNPDYFSYTLSKAALQAATVMLAQALAPEVRVCGVAPGVTLMSGPMTPEEFERAHTLTPLRRSSTPADIARTVRFLIESPAITGTTVLVDGGQHLQGQTRDVMFLAQMGRSS
jgi:NAD(P)-dependent dehydrogenase (short-subunit alcohol dehydrogenase family)